MPEAINDSSVRFPRNHYTFRLLSHEFKTAQRTGNPMVKLEWEVAAPDQMRIGTDMYVCAGMQTTNYLMLNRKSIDRSKKWLKKVGVNIPLTADLVETSPEDIDWSPLDNLCIKAIGESRVKPQTGQEYDAEGKLVTVQLKDDNGKPITTWEFGFQLDSDITIGQVEAPVRNAPY